MRQVDGVITVMGNLDVRTLNTGGIIKQIKQRGNVISVEQLNFEQEVKQHDKLSLLISTAM